MELTNELHPSELFRYVHLRGARKPAIPKQNLKYVAYETFVSSPTEGSLYQQLLSAKNGNAENLYTVLRQKAQDFQATENYFSNLELLGRAFPQLDKLVANCMENLKYSENFETDLPCGNRVSCELVGNFLKQSSYQEVVHGKKVVAFEFFFGEKDNIICVLNYFVYFE
jgi:hypothetical protein